MAKMRVLITGGAGFIGVNVAARHIRMGNDVTILDNLSRKGSEMNLAWLKNHGKFEFIKANVEDGIIKQSFDLVFHLAAQVAVTSSVINPVHDFNVNAYGTLCLLESVRLNNPDAIFVYSSTNKVYGSLEGLKLHKGAKRYQFSDNRQGIAEDQFLDFHSPYGCSKGCGDQYVHDYARIYGLHTVVLRQSCIYGPRQFGIEGQGWLAWLTRKAFKEEFITVYGNGKQVRDVLHVNDLLDCYDRVVERIEDVKGKIYNIGGGMENQISLLELLELLEEVSGKKLKWRKKAARQGDQRIYVSDISKAKNELGWSPKIPLVEGLPGLYEWIKESLAC